MSSAAPELDYEYDGSFLDDEAIADSEFLSGEDANSADADFVEEKKETATAKKYRLKTRHGINFLITGLVQSPGTVPDAAALLYHGPAVSEAIGNLADKDKRVRAAIDFLTEDTIDNPYALTAIAVLPLAIQMLRNHEPQGANVAKNLRVKVPFTKRYFTLPIKIKFSFKWTKNVSYEPNYMVDHVFGNPNVQMALAKRGIRVAWPTANAQHNGSGR